MTLAYRIERIAKKRDECVVCREPIEQPANGRPRLLCRSARCRRLRKVQLALPAWNRFDWAEAVSLWRGCCAICEATLPMPVAYRDILPVHWSCQSKPLPARAKNWLDNVRHGCPFPNPFLGES